MIVVHVTFKLKPAADREAFLAADKTMQEEVMHQMRGFVRRTLAYNEDVDEWIAAMLWADGPLAMHEPAFAQHPLVKAVGEFVDESTIAGRAYQDIGG